jgi:ABC-type multidrug transport system permease subunit
MRNILIIARKELLSAFSQRNLLFIMFLSPIVLVAIMGLAFGGLGGVSDVPDFAAIHIAVVNQDQGFHLQQQLPVSASQASLSATQIEIGGQKLNVGELLLQNPNLGLQGNDFAGGNFSINFGNQLAAILLSQPISAGTMISGINGIDLKALTCPLLPDDAQGEDAFTGSLADLLEAEVVNEPAAARAAVVSGEYAAAVIIPPDFSNQLAPDFGFNVTGTLSATDVTTASGAVEVIANNATPISGNIVRAVVESITGQFERINVALSALAQTTIEDLQKIDLAQIDAGQLDPSLFNLGLISKTLQNIDASVLSPLGCLLLPGANNIQIEQQPLDETQEHSAFSALMVTLGGAQAVFFALFTGVFGLNSVYEDRRQGTFQRVLASPTTSSQALFGRLLGNLVLVFCQLSILLLAFTTITSLVERQLIFVWGTNLPALLLLILGLSLFTTSMGALIVGLAASPEQVQIIGPLITLALGALGGTFGSFVPPSLSRFSPTWWGLNAMHKLSVRDTDIGMNLLVLFGVGILLALMGTYFFRRRLDL